VSRFKNKNNNTGNGGGFSWLAPPSAYTTDELELV